jgi:hypothetical protein
MVMCYPSHHVVIMSIFVLRFCSNLQTVTVIAVFCENIINGSRVEREAIK